MNLSISPRTVSLWRLEYTLFLGGAGLLLGCLAVFSLILSAILQGLALAAYFYLVLDYAPRRREKYRIQLKDGILTTSYGVWIQRRVAVSLNRVQTVQVRRSPTQRLFGLCSVILSLPGTRLALPGLEVSSCRGLLRAVRGRKGSPS